MGNMIRFYETETTKSVLQEKDKFEFRRDLKYPRTQKLCFWLLKKIGAFANTDIVTEKRFLFDCPDFMEKLYKMDEVVFNHVHRGARHVLIGPEEFHDMIADTEIKHCVSFTGNYRYGNNSGIQIMNMTVTVVPWMSGILPLPRGFDSNKIP
jgi:hypothetical protein